MNAGAATAWRTRPDSVLNICSDEHNAWLPFVERASSVLAQAEDVILTRSLPIDLNPSHPAAP